jgi:hypothetical protein
MFLGAYLGVSLLSLVAIFLMRGDANVVNSAVWLRGWIVFVSAVLTTAFAAWAARRYARAYLRLRVATTLMTVAIAVIVALPGLIPLWMKVEQSACGLLLLGVVVIVNGRHLRAQFATPGVQTSVRNAEPAARTRSGSEDGPEAW